MRRKLSHLAVVFSLLICVTVFALWGRSYWRYDSVAVVDNTVEQEGDHGVLWQRYAVYSGRGVLRLAIEDNETRIRSDEAWPAPRPAWEFRRFADRIPPRLDLTNGRARFGFSSGSDFGMGTGGSSSERYLTVPYWAVATATVVLALPILKRVRARRARGTGRCPACGYDLRATPDRCPECGTIGAKPAAA